MSDKLVLKADARGRITIPKETLKAADIKAIEGCFKNSFQLI